MTIIKDIYNSIYGKNYEAVWKQFSTENNGTYSDAHNSVEISYSNHKILFDTYIHHSVVGEKSYETEFTRVRLEFISPDNLRLRLTKQAFVDTIGKLFGAQDIQIGDNVFDKRFMIKGNDEFKIQTLFANEIIKNLILEQSDIHLQILDKEGIFDEPIQDGNVMLYYISETVVKGIAQLNSLLKLYTSLIDHLTKLSSIKALKLRG